MTCSKTNEAALQRAEELLAQSWEPLDIPDDVPDVLRAILQAYRDLELKTSLAKLRQTGSKSNSGRTCWCPCNCGCQEPYFAINVSGLCPDCENQNHEVVPDGVQMNGRDATEYLRDMHEEIAQQYRMVLRARKREDELLSLKIDCQHGVTNFNLTGRCEFNYLIGTDTFACVFCNKRAGWE